MKVFVGLFGMNRSLEWTARSINDKILRPISAAANGVYIGGHFNVPVEIGSSDDGGRSAAHLTKGLNQVQFDMLWLERQSDENIRTLFDFMEPDGIGDMSAEEIQMIKNHFQQLHSLQRLWQILNIAGNDRFEIFVFVRPDLEYLDCLEFGKVAESILTNDEDLITPHWHQWGGLNDRIAICSKVGARAYLNRLSYLGDFFGSGQKVHSETLLAYVAKRETLKLGYTSVRGLRVRANGRTKLEEFRLSPGQWTKYKIRNANAILRSALTAGSTG